MLNNSDKIKKCIESAFGNMCHAVFDLFAEKNAAKKARAGIKTFVDRVVIGKCCEWCESLKGHFLMGEQPEGVFKRHDHCNCLVTYKTEKGYSDVWSKKEFQTQKEARIAREQEILAEREARKVDIVYRAKEKEKSLKPGDIEKLEKELKKLRKSPLLGMKTQEELSDYFKEQHNIVLIKFEDMNVIETISTLSGVDDMLRRFPGCSYIKTIEYCPQMKCFGKMWTKGLMQIGPKGLGNYGTGVHETIHAIDFYMSPITTKTGFSKEIKKEAIKELKLKKGSKKYNRLFCETVGFNFKSDRVKEESSDLLAYSAEIEYAKGISNELTKVVVRIFEEKIKK